MPPSTSDDPGSPPPDGTPGRYRLLVIQSDIAPAEELAHAFPVERFDVTFAGDALTVMAAATARDVDVVLLDAPLFDVEIDTLLWRLDSERLSVPVVVLGATPPPQPMRLRFPVQYLPKPAAAARILEAVTPLARARRRHASLAPAGGAPAATEDKPQDFLEWSQLAAELAGDDELPSVPPPPKSGFEAPPSEPPPPAVEPGASEPEATVEVEPEATVEVEPEATVEVTPTPDAADVARAQDAEHRTPPPLPSGPAGRGPARMGPMRTLIAPAAVPAPPRSAGAPSPPVPGVAVEQLLTVEPGGVPGPGALDGRSVVLVGRSSETMARLGLALRDAGMDVRILEGALRDVLPAMRETCPDLLLLELGEVSDLERALELLRVEVRLWHRPVVVVSGAPAVQLAAKAADT